MGTPTYRYPPIARCNRCCRRETSLFPDIYTNENTSMSSKGADSKSWAGVAMLEGAL